MLQKPSNVQGLNLILKDKVIQVTCNYRPKTGMQIPQVGQGRAINYRKNNPYSHNWDTEAVSLASCYMRTISIVPGRFKYSFTTYY